MESSQRSWRHMASLGSKELIKLWGIAWNAQQPRTYQWPLQHLHFLFSCVQYFGVTVLQDYTSHTQTLVLIIHNPCICVCLASNQNIDLLCIKHPCIRTWNSGMAIGIVYYQRNVSTRTSHSLRGWLQLMDYASALLGRGGGELATLASYNGCT